MMQSRTTARVRPLALGAIAAVALGLAAPPAGAQAEAPYKMELYNGLMSPYCPGRTLMDCPSEQAAQLRDWIAAQEAAGVPRAQVEEDLYRRYGDVILQAPRAEGFGLAAYVIPTLLVAVGAAVVWLFLRRQGVPAGAGLPTRGRESLAGGARGPVAIDPEIERRIDEEMRA